MEMMMMTKTSLIMSQNYGRNVAMAESNLVLAAARPAPAFTSTLQPLGGTSKTLSYSAFETSIHMI
jgi:hypothetical protein